jgi:hypothetical protein
MDKKKNWWKASMKLNKNQRKKQKMVKDINNILVSKPEKQEELKDVNQIVEPSKEENQ